MCCIALYYPLPPFLFEPNILLGCAFPLAPFYNCQKHFWYVKTFPKEVSSFFILLFWRSVAGPTGILLFSPSEVLHHTHTPPQREGLAAESVNTTIRNQTGSLKSNSKHAPLHPRLGGAREFEINHLVVGSSEQQYMVDPSCNFNYKSVNCICRSVFTKDLTRCESWVCLLICFAFRN